jgi:DNA ligase D-like protein (predicted 3'-phosphoesterase)
VLRSWAVPKGPSLDPGERRLAIQVPDHSLEHADFEGVHEESPRGSGAVIVWDEGEFDLLREEPDHLVVELRGHKLRGGFALTRTGERQWVLVKMVDDDARRGSDVVAERPESVRSGRTWQEVAGA